MKVTIGLLAYNEQDCIASMIKHVCQQDIFLNPNLEVQFLVVANGCTDKTVSIASDAVNLLNKEVAQCIEIIDIETAGKSNAWNCYVHELSWQNADYYILIDADIELGSANVLSKLVQALEDDSQAVASVDLPRKDVEKQLKKGILTRLSIGVSGANQNGRSVISGQLYCMRGETIRNIYMPVGLPVEDGFLRAMVVTENFRHDDDETKITAVNDVFHYFEALLSPIKLYQHEKRLIIGSSINRFVYQYLWRTVSPNGEDAGVLIHDLNKEHPNWLIELIDSHRASEGFWIVKKNMILKRLTQLIKGNKSLKKKVLLFPIAVAATVVSFVIAINVNFYFRKNNGLGHW